MTLTQTDITPREKGAELSSVLRPVRKRKKGRPLGPVDIVRREDYADLELDAKVELIRSLVPLGLMHVEEVLDAEVPALAGERYARKDASIGGRRHGGNPGTVGLAGQRVPIRVPRIRRVAGGEIPLRSYAALHGDGAVNDVLLKRVRYGISCRNYEAAAEAIPGAIGLAGSTVSRGFIQASAAQLRDQATVDGLDSLIYFKYTQTMDGDGLATNHAEPKIHPAVGQLRAARMAKKAMLVEFGQTSASRSQVKVPEQPAEPDPFAEFEGLKVYAPTPTTS